MRQVMIAGRIVDKLCAEYLKCGELSHIINDEHLLRIGHRAGEFRHRLTCSLILPSSIVFQNTRIESSLSGGRPLPTNREKTNASDRQDFPEKSCRVAADIDCDSDGGGLIMAIRWKAIQAALAMAGHATTPDHEAAAAIRKAKQLLEAGDKTLDDLTLVTGSVPKPPIATLREIERLNKDITNAERRVAELETALRECGARSWGMQKRIGELEDQPKAKPIGSDLFDDDIESSEQWKAAHDARQKELDKARSELASERASARKAQPAVNPELQRENAVLRKTLEHLREVVSDRMYGVAKAQGEAYYDETGLVGEFGWCRRSASQRRTKVHTSRQAKAV